MSRILHSGSFPGQSPLEAASALGVSSGVAPPSSCLSTRRGGLWACAAKTIRKDLDSMR